MRRTYLEGVLCSNPIAARLVLWYTGAMIDSRMDLVRQVEAWARERLETGGADSASHAVAHGWLHVDRVRRAARALAPPEGVPVRLAECAALLHDVGRTVPGPESEHGQRSAELAAPFLAELRPESPAALVGSDRDAILHAVRWHNSVRDDTRLLCVLRDADMLDGLGAVGLMRAFTSKAALPPYDERGVMLGGHFLRPPRSIADQIHFQIAWSDFLNTATAREMARERVAFMRVFVEQWHRELSQPLTARGKLVTLVSPNNRKAVRPQCPE